MSRKRKSSEMMESQPEATGARAVRPSRARTLLQDYNELCQKASIELQYDVLASPGQIDKSNIQNRVYECYKYLWWQKKNGDLDQAVGYFFDDLNNNRISKHSQYQKVTRLLQLLEELKNTKIAQLTPSARRFHDVALEANAPPSPQSPPSPSKKGRGITGHFGVSKNPRLSFDSKSIPAPPLLTQPSASQPGAVATFVAPQAAATSFTSNATKSFKNDSFWSNPAPSGSQDTEITQFSQDDSPPSKRSSTLYYSSMASSEIAEATAIVQQAESSQNSNSTDQTARQERRPTSADLRRETQSTNYGSSIGPGDVDQLQVSSELQSNKRTSQLDSAGRFSFTTEITSSALACENVHSDLSDMLHKKPGYGAARVLQDLSPANQYLAHSRDDARPTDGASDFASSGAPEDGHIDAVKRPRLKSYHEQQSSKKEKSAVQEPFCLKIPPTLRHLSFELQYEAQLALQTGKISPEELESEWKFTSLGSLYRIMSDRKIQMENVARSGDLKQYEVLTRTARLQWAKSRGGPALEMVVQPLRKETACGLQRHLGPDRVLYVEIPDLNKPPTIFKGRDVQRSFREWLSSPHEFLGSKWYLFFLQPNKKKAGFSDKATGVGATDKSAAVLHRLIFVNPPPGKTICDIIDWCVPFKTNSHRPARKTYMRLELQLSRTVVAAVLKPEEFELVEDKIATDEVDDRQFEDPALSHEFHEYNNPDEPVVMNDGCNEMQQWIAYRYMKILGLPRMPPCLQIRAAGAKGLWYISENGKIEKRPEGILMKLSPSQIKVSRNTFEGCDDETLSVCVVRHNPPAKPSILHLQFLPILINRGVPEGDLRELVKSQTQEAANELLHALEAPDTISLRHWMSRQKEFSESKTREQGIETLAGFPRSTEERVIQMLEQGFDPKEYKFLAGEVMGMIKHHFDFQKRNFKIELPKSSTLFGIADPIGVLAPGEVSVIFGTLFDNPVTGKSCWFLDQVEGLICRNPALAPWDIQKIRFVFKPELAQFKDLVIFSTKGMRPLANKLQGGDYDGDAFWFTWEEKLVRHFKNAPAPWQPPQPETFGIVKDKSLVADHISNPQSESQYCTWLSHMARKRMDANMLGNVTLYLERLNYVQGTIDTESSKLLTHLHDYLVDSDKQGYDFDQSAFDAWRKRIGLAANLPIPAYWKFTRGEDDQNKAKEKDFYQVGKTEVKGNIIDTVYFDIVGPVIQSALGRVSDILRGAGQYDLDLAKYYNQTCDDPRLDSETREELVALKENLVKVREVWMKTNKQRPWPENIHQLRTMYDNIQPMNPRNSKVEEWLRRQGHGYTIWDKLKASCFAKTQYFGEKPGQLLFSVAGTEICDLKMFELDEKTRSLQEPYYNALKMRRSRQIILPDDFDDDAGDPDEALEQAGYY